MMKTANIMYLILIVIVLLVTSCDKGNYTDCGCGGQIQYTIPDSLFLQGEISLKIQKDSLDDYYINKYWIGFTEQNCTNCIHHYIVCNDDFLSSELESELQSGQQLKVNFSGIVTETCLKTFAPADYTYNRIFLTKIEKR